jgi:hypothetical protein
MESSKLKFADYGPYSHWNWRCQLEKDESTPPYSAQEVQLFSDAHFIGTNIEHGPYFLMNAEPFQWSSPELSQLMYARLVLRVEQYLDPREDPTISPRGTDTSRYHGGTFLDEMAALYSLCWGVRLRAGGVVREFSSLNGYDIYGQPRTPTPDETPIFLPPHDGKYVLPWHPTDRQIGDIQEQIKSYILLSPKEASTLIRSARLYQDSVWLAESNPEISWLLLASAVEVAANHWIQEELAFDSEEELKYFNPRLVKELENLEHDRAEAIETVSKHLKGLLGATKKFRQFLLRFRPQEPPVNRPNFLQVEWSEDSMKDIFNKIYNHRSLALHEGIPFPEPMCRPPGLDYQNNIPRERPDTGLFIATLGASWKAKDVPIHFHVFEYIVRHSLLNWWQDMVAKQHSSKGTRLA